MIGRHIGHAVGKRRRCLLRERAGRGIDGIGQYACWLRADDGIKVFFARAHRHRHDQFGGLGLADRRQRAGARIHHVGVDISVLRVRHVDERLGHGHRGHSDYKQQRERDASRCIPWQFHFCSPQTCQKSLSAAVSAEMSLRSEAEAMGIIRCQTSRLKGDSLTRLRLSMSAASFALFWSSAGYLRPPPENRRRQGRSPYFKAAKSRVSRLVATLAKCLRSTSQECANPSVGARRFDTTLAFALKGIWAAACLPRSYRNRS